MDKTPSLKPCPFCGEPAKAAAQADYEARILAALSQPEAQEPLDDTSIRARIGDTVWIPSHAGEYGTYYPEAVEAEGEHGGIAVSFHRAPPAAQVTVAEAIRLADALDGGSYSWAQIKEAAVMLRKLAGEGRADG